MLTDVLERGLDLVVCGTAAGTWSARVGHYYAGPGNKFWRTLAEIGLTDRQLEPEEFRSLLTYGIGLTDLVKAQSGSDRSLRFDSVGVEQLHARMAEYEPRYLCFNGKRAAQEFFGASPIDYGVQARRLGRTALFVAPSTSGAASGFWNPAVWQDLGARILRGRAAGK